MKKYILFLFSLTLSMLFQSCNHAQINKQNAKQPSITKIMDISSYKGNSVVFFVKGHNDFYSAYIIPIMEKDSNVFKKDDFDVFNATMGRCSISIYIGYILYDLQNSETKKKLDRKICNVHADYYAKIWISYQDYEELLTKREKVLKSDSCEIRSVTHGNKGKLLEFKILKDII